MFGAILDEFIQFFVCGRPLEISFEKYLPLSVTHDFRIIRFLFDGRRIVDLHLPSGLYKIINVYVWFVLITLLNLLHLVSSNLHNDASIRDKLYMKKMHIDIVAHLCEVCSSLTVNVQLHIHVWSYFG